MIDGSEIPPFIEGLTEKLEERVGRAGALALAIIGAILLVGAAIACAVWLTV